MVDPSPRVLCEPILDPTWSERVHLDIPGPQEHLLDPVDHMQDDDDDDDDEWEEDQVSYLTLDFGRHLTSTVWNANSTFQLLAPNSATPFVKLGSAIFRGQHERLLGSEILFQRDHHNPSSLTPIGTTSDRILFYPVTLIPHLNPGGGGAGGLQLDGTTGFAPAPVHKKKMGLRDPSVPKKKPGPKPKPKPVPGDAVAPAGPSESAVIAAAAASNAMATEGGEGVPVPGPTPAGPSTPSSATTPTPTPTPTPTTTATPAPPLPGTEGGSAATGEASTPSSAGPLKKKRGRPPKASNLAGSAAANAARSKAKKELAERELQAQLQAERDAQAGGGGGGDPGPSSVAGGK